MFTHNLKCRFFDNHAFSWKRLPVVFLLACFIPAYGSSITTVTSFTLTNDTSTGTTNAKLAKVNSSGNGIIAGTSDTAIPVYVVMSGGGTTGSAILATAGLVKCTADTGGATIAHFIVASTVTGGDCADAGATAPTSGWVIGVAQTTASSGATFTVALTVGYNAAAGGATSNQNIRSIGGGFDGGGTALSTGGVTYFTVPFACTIAAWNITVDTGTISFDVWKIATGTAIPTITNTILTGGYLSLSTGTAIHSTSLTNFSITSVSANDILAVEIEAVSSATKASLVLQCNAS